MDYWVLAYYCLADIAEPHLEVRKHQNFFSTRDLKGRIYISEQGINGQMSGSASHAEEYMEWLRSDLRFANVSFKMHQYFEHAFPKATIKYRRQLVAMDCDVDLSKRGESITPSEWKEMLNARDDDTLVLDVRNDYEWKVGHFEGAELPPLESFRQFPSYAKQLKEARDPKKTKVMMYCTGGIRCEFYSAVMKKEGFEQVYQLDGGVIQYGLDEGQNQWEGKLFVFDDRLVIPISEETAPPISVCSHCQASDDTYYNCANMDCNALFVCCSTCVQEKCGCCSTECQNAPRVRPIQPGSSKPFRKWDHAEKIRMNQPC
ncbi:MAG TPA: rhodanese-related sulfurtransferase [Chlamydiales bacterium]|nr:rhodanese-related sulfurtransferase [Chlamydiales bacterium]